MFEVGVDEAVEDAAVEPLQEDRHLIQQSPYHKQPLEEIPLEARLVEVLELPSDAAVVELLVQPSQIEGGIDEDCDDDVLEEVVVGLNVEALQHAGMAVASACVCYCGESEQQSQQYQDASFGPVVTLGLKRLADLRVAALDIDRQQEYEYEAYRFDDVAEPNHAR